MEQSVSIALPDVATILSPSLRKAAQCKIKFRYSPTLIVQLDGRCRVMPACTGAGLSSSGERAREALPWPAASRSIGVLDQSGQHALAEEKRLGRPMPSRPGEFHPEPLTDPDLTLSVIRLVPPTEGCRLPSRIGAPPVASRLAPDLSDLPPLLHGLTPLHHYYGAVRPWPAHQYFRPRGWAACAFSLRIADQVLKFHARAQMRVTPPIHRTPYGQ